MQHLLIPKELINEAKNRLGEKAAHIIAKDLQLENFDEQNLKAICKWHDEKTGSLLWDSKPNQNFYKCFGCGRTYNIVDHYMSFYKLTFIDAVQKLFQETEVSYRFAEKGIKTKREYKYPRREESADRTKVENYLAKRKISRETIDYCDVQQDGNGNIVWHLYDTNDVLLSVKYRPARVVKHGETKEWCQKDSDFSNILFNMNRIDPTQPLVITEGYGDTLAVIESGYKNAVSIPSGAQNERWIEECSEWLDQFEKIIVWSDNDAAGLNMRKSVCARLGSWRTYFVDLPLEVDGHKVKDANDVLYHCGKQKVLDFIDSPSEIPVSKIVDLYNVSDYNIEDAQGLFTGINEIDDKIYKIVSGTLTIITGINSCVDSKTEYFNGYEWKKISQYRDGDLVLQYNLDGTSELVSPQHYIKEPCDDFYLIKNFAGINQCVTRNHNMVYLTSKKHIAKISFDEMYQRHKNCKNGFQGKFITTFNHFGNNQEIPLSDDEIRLMVAVCADGHFPNKGNSTCRFRVKKERKKERIRELLTKCNLPIDERVYNETYAEGFSNFYFTPPMKFKEFPKEWYNAPIRQLKIIFEECILWDGSGKYNAYFTTKKNDADFIQYVMTVCGYRTYIYNDIREGRTTAYEVRYNKTTHPSIMHLGIDHLKNEHIKKYDNHDGYKYCFTVPSGMLVLRRNGVINITGNSGKSVLTNQMCICEPLNQGYDTFVLSAELPKDQFKSWIEWNLAGRENITVKNKHVKHIEEKSQKQLREWYKGRIYLYDDEIDRTSETIMAKMEEMARKYGTKVFVLDNLAMIDFQCGKDDVYLKQKDFIIKLRDFANRYNVWVFLVAHPRKIEMIRRLTKLDVGGTGAITDLAHYVFGLHRYTAKERSGEKGKGSIWKREPVEHDCVIDVFKNRITGTQDFEVKLYFDLPSYRFYTKPEELWKRYKWNKDTSSKPRTDDPNKHGIPEFMQKE
jgi:5S rRNA maturation endonuclease (ribonuclease M5)